MYKTRKGKHYAEWNAERKGEPTLRFLIKKDVDYAINHSFSMNDFIIEMENLGYVVSTNRKYIAVQHPKSKRMIRLKSITRDSLYSEENIMNRIINNSIFINVSNDQSKIKCIHINEK